MNFKTLLAATIAVPLLLVACDKQQTSPTASVQSQDKQDKQAVNPSPDRMLEKSPPAAGNPAPSDSAAPSSSDQQPSGSAPMNAPSPPSDTDSQSNSGAAK